MIIISMISILRPAVTHIVHTLLRIGIMITMLLASDPLAQRLDGDRGSRAACRRRAGPRTSAPAVATGDAAALNMRTRERKGTPKRSF